MTKLLVLPLLPGILALTAGVTAKIAGPAARTQAFYGLERNWSAHWPLEIGKSLPERLARHFEPFVPVWLQVEPHVTMLLDPYDKVSGVILQTGTWEPESWRAIAEHLHAGSTFVDIGAHIGYYSLKAAPVVGLGGRVIAVEPNPDTVRRLRDNIRASQADGVISVKAVACSDAEATLELFAASASNTGETSLSRRNASQEGQIAASYRVRARRLDDILKDSGIGRVDVVKIDVEGAEFLVLKGAQEMLERYHPLIIVELVESQLQAMGTSTAEVVALLHSHGYEWRHSYADNAEFAATAQLAAN
jgi:FkbM family methyltransferase